MFLVNFPLNLERFSLAWARAILTPSASGAFLQKNPRLRFLMLRSLGIRPEGAGGQSATSNLRFGLGFVRKPTNAKGQTVLGGTGGLSTSGRGPGPLVDKPPVPPLQSEFSDKAYYVAQCRHAVCNAFENRSRSSSCQARVPVTAEAPGPVGRQSDTRIDEEETSEIMVIQLWRVVRGGRGAWRKTVAQHASLSLNATRCSA